MVSAIDCRLPSILYSFRSLLSLWIETDCQEEQVMQQKLPVVQQKHCLWCSKNSACGAAKTVPVVQQKQGLWCSKNTACGAAKTVPVVQQNTACGAAKTLPVVQQKQGLWCSKNRACGRIEQWS